MNNLLYALYKGNCFSFFVHFHDIFHWMPSFSWKGPVNSCLYLPAFVSPPETSVGITIIRIKKAVRHILRKILGLSFVFPKNGQNGSKLLFVFWIFWKIVLLKNLFLVFPGNNLNWKIMMFFIFHNKHLIWDNFGYGLNMLLANQITGFFKLWYLNKELRDQIDFLYINKHQSFLWVDITVFGRCA